MLVPDLPTAFMDLELLKVGLAATEQGEEGVAYLGLSCVFHNQLFDSCLDRITSTNIAKQKSSQQALEKLSTFESNASKEAPHP